MAYDRNKTENRKQDQLAYFRREHCQSKRRTTWLEFVHLAHNALPEINYDEIDISARFLGNEFKAPFFISGMTGGTSEAENINRALARLADRIGIGFGLGSMRAMIENPQLTRTYKVRDVAPTVFLAGNIGGTQLTSIPLGRIQKALDEIQADAICVHLNPAHEIMQPEGDRDFSGVLDAVARLVDVSEIPVIVKETGAGISREVVMKLTDVGVRAIDVAGCGGTSWVEVELERQGKGEDPELMDFCGWGIPTAAAICDLVENDIELIASGGIRTGLDVAKSIVLGANMVGIAAPIMRSYFKGGVSDCASMLDNMLDGLKISMLLTGCSNNIELRETRKVLSGPLLEWIYSQR